MKLTGKLSSEFYAEDFAMGIHQHRPIATVITLSEVSETLNKSKLQKGKFLVHFGYAVMYSFS